MRLSEFRLAVADEFGAYGSTITRDLVLGDLGGLTADQAVSKGMPAREIWLALCKASDVPESRWHGVGQRTPRE